MSTTNDTARQNALEMITKKVNHVEGFDPEALAEIYPRPTPDDPNKTEKRLPVIVQIAWFRMKHPNGKLLVTVTVDDKNYFIAHARVYLDYKDSEEHFVAEATVSRCYNIDNPKSSPREWAQTAAIGVALRNAGFCLPANSIGEGFDNDSGNETEGITPMVPPLDVMVESGESGNTDSPVSVQGITDNAAEIPPAPDLPTETETDPFEAAKKVPCPIAKHKNKTLGDLITENPGALSYIATKGTDKGYDPKAVEAAILICEHALENAS